MADIVIATHILTDPSVFDMICDDGGMVDKNEFVKSYLEHDKVFCLHPNQWTVFIFVPRNTVMYEAHTAILPDGRGKNGVRAGKAALSWMFTETTCLKVISLVPTFNRMAGIFARWCGLTKEGFLKKSFLKNERLFGQTIYGITRKEWEKCQQQFQSQ
jgi:RimJ/RimL family protein N-acetyltransferase